MEAGGVQLKDEVTLAPPSWPPSRVGGESPGAEDGAPASTSVPSLEVGQTTHVGRVRVRNEDSVLVVTMASLGDFALPAFGLFIVADGMGGHSDGHQASHLAARTVARYVMEKVLPPFLSVDRPGPHKPIQDILAEAVEAANWEVRARHPESGTTLTAALVLGDRLYVAHVGDSRAYLIRGSESAAELLTLDHSLVRRLLDTGQVTAEEAASHPQRNVLYRAVGQGERLEVDTSSRPVPRSSSLLLCSDGLWGAVDAEILRAAVALAATPQDACEELVQAALSSGGSDNISVVVIRFD